MLMQLQIFTYEDGSQYDFTTIEINNEPWFIANEVCSLLEIQNSSQAVSALDEDEKLVYTLYISGQFRKVNIVNESGLYALIFRSNKEGAKRFRKWVTKEVIPLIRKTGSYGINRLETPNFIIRYFENWNKTDRGHFSIIRELFVDLYGRLEMVGYKIPNKAVDGKEIRPDVSVGLLFNKFLAQHHPTKVQNFKTYKHSFPNGTEFDCKQYPNEILHIFRQFVEEVWIPNRAAIYFAERDRKALDYLPKLLEAA